MEGSKIDNISIRMQNNFESAAAHLLPYDPVQKKRKNNNKRGSAEISDVNGDYSQVSAFGTDPGIGNTGVCLRYHKLADYRKLLKPHKDKLREWRKKKNEWNGGKVKAKKHNTNTKLNNRTKTSITYAVNKKFTERMKDLYQDKDDAKEVKACIVSITQKYYGKKKSSVSGATRSSTTIIIPGTLKSITKREKNQNGVLNSPYLQVSSLSSKSRRLMHPDSKTLWDPGIDYDPVERKNSLK